MPAARLLTLCESSDAVLTALLAELPGLVVATDVDMANLSALGTLMQQHALETDFLLLFERDELVLCRADAKGRFGKHRIALDTSAVVKRASAVTELHRACLGARGGSVRVLDLFAGWGMDAFALAAAGARVTCVEMQPAMVALLRDATRRIQADIAERLTILHGDGLSYLSAQNAQEMDVIYLDPMFPARRKGALPNKRLQWLAELTRGDSVALAPLLELASTRARKQVVLKRRRNDPVIGSPVRQLSGSSVRYDIYPSSH